MAHATDVITKTIGLLMMMMMLIMADNDDFIVSNNNIQDKLALSINFCWLVFYQEEKR